MKAPGCERIALADLTDYAAGELPAGRGRCDRGAPLLVCRLRRARGGVRRARAARSDRRCGPRRSAGS